MKGNGEIFTYRVKETDRWTGGEGWIYIKSVLIIKV